MVNKQILVGRLGADMKLRQAGEAVVGHLSIFVSKKFKDKQGEPQERVEIFHVQVWNKLAEKIEHLMKKGSLVYCAGETITRRKTDDDGREIEYKVIDADEVHLLMLKERKYEQENYT